MSHFTVMIKLDPESTETIEDVMEPFCEQSEIDFDDSTDEVNDIWNPNEPMDIHIDKRYGDGVEFIYVDGVVWYDVKKREFTYDKHIDRYEASQIVPILVQDAFKNKAEFAKEYFGYQELEGRYGHWYNPDARWDWWVLGGRWRRMLTLKKGAKEEWPDAGENGTFGEEANEKIPKGETCVDVARFKDIEFSKSFGKTERFSTYSILDENGDWHEAGSMGWFGMSNASDEECAKHHDEYHKNHLEGTDPETIIAVVDCHI